MDAKALVVPVTALTLTLLACAPAPQRDAAGATFAPTTGPQGEAPLQQQPPRHQRGAAVPFDGAFRSRLEAFDMRRSGSAYVAPDSGPHEFYFTRAAYSGPLSRGFASWSVDYPKADVQFLIGLSRLVTRLDAYPLENPVLLDDPDISHYPFLYAVEVGYMSLTEAEAKGLRRYLLAGGFLVIDDFWGSREWYNLERELSRVLPEYAVIDLPLDHPIFHTFYDVNEVLQVPNVGQGRSGGPTWERDGFVPVVRGVFDEHDRLMVVINWNSDLGDAWEWAEDPFYPLRFSTYAYQMGVNFIVYAMSH